MFLGLEGDVTFPADVKSSDGSVTITTANGSYDFKVSTAAMIAGLSAQPFFNITPYLTDLTADQTANIQAGCTAAGAGKTVVFPAGSISVGAGGATITPPSGQHWVGQGATGTSGGTLFLSSASSGTHVILTGNGASISNCWAACTQSSTTATFVQLGNGENPTFQKLQNFRVEGFGKAVYVHDGQYYTLEHFMADGAKVVGLHINNFVNGDFGDPAFTDCYFTSCDTGILFSSGGGPKLSGVKIIGGKRGIDIAVADGVSTSDFKIASSSIEGTTEHGIRAQRGGTSGTMLSLALDVQIACDAGNCITIGAGVGDVTIPVSAILASPSGHAVEITGGSNINISPKITNSLLSAVHITGGTGINVDTRNMVIPNNNLLIEDTRDQTISLGNETCFREFTRGPLSLTSSASYTTFFKIQPPANSGGELDLTLEVNATGAAGGAVSGRYVYSRGTGVTTVVGTPVTSGTSVDLNLDVSLSDGSILVQAKLHPSTGGTAAVGSLTMRQHGRMSNLYVF